MERVAFKCVVWTLLTVVSLSCSLKSTTDADPGTVLGCVLHNDTYICIGSQHRMHCNTRKHHFYYQRNQKQLQYQCLSNDCICVANSDTCGCYNITSSCFCETFSNNVTISTAVSPVWDCVLNNSAYTCIGAQYHMYCDTAVNYFRYNIYKLRTQYLYYCGRNCDCRFTKNSCTCYGAISSSCFCTSYGYSITLSSGQSPPSVPDCVLYNSTYICTGAQYRMYCNTIMHNFLYSRNQNQIECSNNCYCYFNMGSCTCSPSTLSSCFCETLSSGIAFNTTVSPVSTPDCVLNNDIYTCTGAQYHMHCNTQVHYFSYQRYQNQDQYLCVSIYCNCIGNKDTCRCSPSSLSSCFCETRGNIIALTASVSPVYDCVLYNDTYICTGDQYHMYCNTTMHELFYSINEHRCTSSTCYCTGNKNNCSCSTSAPSSCYCTSSSNSITIPAAVSPAYDCGLYKDTYICTGAQYRMYCNTSMHDFNYWKYSFQSIYQCVNKYSDCTGNKETCTCDSSTLSTRFCETYGNIIALTASVSPVYDCVLYNDTYICTGDQYRMYCNTSMHDLFYSRNNHHCRSSSCYCTGNKNSCSCSSSAPSSCYCTNSSNSITIPAAVSPVYDCGLYNDTYICTGAQYRMFCNTKIHYFRYQKNGNQEQYQCVYGGCYCIGNKDTCICFSSTLSSCFCGSNISTPSIPGPTTAPTITITDECKTSGGCLESILQQLENIKDLPLTVVTSVLDVALHSSEISQSADSKEFVENGNRLLRASEKLISALVKPTDTSDNVSFTLETIEVKVFSIGPKFALDTFPQLDTKNASMKIDLIGIAKSNKDTGSAAVAFMSYTTMENLLKPELFNASNDTINTMMSTVISATLPKTNNTQLTKPVNFTFRHIRGFAPEGSLSCVYWNISEWIVDGCSVLNTNSSFTVCSCVHLSTFALIMQTSRPPLESDLLLYLLNLVCVIVGSLFFILALISFAFCRWSPGVNNVARTNICISLLSAHLLLLLTQHFLNLIVPQQVWCVVIAGLLHFLFLSGFVWMFIEAVLLYISVKNLSQISTKKKEVLSSGFLCVVGYVVALVVVSVSVGLRPEGHGSEKCWIKLDKGFIWSFLGPVCVILASNMILFIKIVICLNSALGKLNAEVSQMKQTKIIMLKTLAQFVVLGCPWLLGFFINNSKVLEILFLVLNSQQGTFIFLIYCVLNNEIRQQYRKFFTFLCSGRSQQTQPAINRHPKKF